MLLGFAELSNVFHVQSVIISEQLNRRIADRGVEQGGQLPETEFKNLMALADRLIGVAKATDTCNRTTSTIIEARAIDSPIFPRLPHSA